MKAVRTKTPRATIALWILAGTAPIFIGSSAWAFPGAGSGTATDPYQITTVTQLQQMTRNLNACYVLMQDVDAYETRSWNDNAGFQPIGCQSAPFTGRFDGNSHEIAGLYINRPTNDCVGLFGGTQHAVITGVGLAHVDITGHDFVGALAGQNYDHYQYRTLTTKCSSSGTVRGRDFPGGLIGHVYDMHVEECYSTADVEGGQHVGGFAGYLSFSHLRRCYATGTVRGKDNVGGLCGTTDGTPGHPIVVNNCFAAGQVTASGVKVGGLVGYLGSDGRFGDWTRSYYIDRRPESSYGAYESDGPAAFEGNRSHPVFSTWDFNTVWKSVSAPPAFPVFAWQSVAETLGAGPLRVGARLIDGSLIIGIPATSALSVVTRYGRMTLPLESVALIRMAKDRETTVFEMRKGDRVTGVLEGHDLVLETVFGKISIEMNLVLHIKVYPASPPRAMSTKPWEQHGNSERRCP